LPIFLAQASYVAPLVLHSFPTRRSSDLTDRQFLWTTRFTVAAFTVIVTSYAVATDATIHTMVENAYRITLAGAFVPLAAGLFWRSEEHTSELQSRENLVCRLLLEKKKKK